MNKQVFSQSVKFALKSLTRYFIISQVHFVNLKNYQYLLFMDRFETFQIILKVYLEYRIHFFRFHEPISLLISFLIFTFPKLHQKILL